MWVNSILLGFWATFTSNGSPCATGPLIPLRMEVGHALGDIVLHGDPAFPHCYCGGFLANVNSRSRSLYAIAHPSVCRLSVCLSSVTFVRPTQAVEIFGNISAALGTLAIH